MLLAELKAELELLESEELNSCKAGYGGFGGYNEYGNLSGFVIRGGTGGFLSPSDNPIYPSDNVGGGVSRGSDWDTVPGKGSEKDPYQLGEVTVSPPNNNGGYYGGSPNYDYRNEGNTPYNGERPYWTYGGGGGSYAPSYNNPEEVITPPQLSTQQLQPRPCKPSCVFNVFDYLDGSRHDACFYYEQTKANLGYEPLSNGGVRTRDIPTIGSYGGFNVQEMGSTAHLRSNGRSYYGNNQVIMSFYDSATRIDHLTVLTGVTNNADGTTTFYYYDPTNNVNGSTQQATGLYEVSNR